MHLLDKFRFCPACGSPHFEDNDERSKRCADCGFTYYLNASAATAAFIVNSKGELLVTRRARDPEKGTLGIPGGFVDPGESITDGMLREIKEETQCEGEIVRFLFSIPNTYEYSGFTVHTSDAFFEVKVADEASAAASDDCSELMWTALKDVRPELFGLRSVRQAVERYLAMTKE